MKHRGYIAFVAGTAVFMTVIVWLSERAASQWERTARMLAEQRAEANVAMLATALTRNMRAVESSLLPDLSSEDHGAPSHRWEAISRALASYSYPETFFSWQHGTAPAAALFYARSERQPLWMPEDRTSARLPVIAGPAPTVAPRLLNRIDVDAIRGRAYSIFELPIDGMPYQVIAQLSYTNDFHDQLESVFGFLVNISWATDSYVRDFASQVNGMRRASGDMGVVLLETASGPNTRSREGPSAGVRTVPLAFFDPRLLVVDWPDDLERRALIARSPTSQDAALAAAHAAIQRTRISVIAAALGLVVAVAVTAKRYMKLVALRSEFVSSVTHELKTPIATIQAISERFAAGRNTAPDASVTHGRLALHEAKRLGRLVDNLLAQARVTDVTDRYFFRPLDARTLVDDTLAEFTSQLEFGKFDVTVDVPMDLPPMRTDRKAMGLALGNLVDNAIRYSIDTRALAIAGRYADGTVVLSVADRGIGIPVDELEQVTHKFFRGQRRDLAGSGLGLAIVDRIVRDHGGSLKIQSALGSGTTVTVSVPVCAS